MSEQPERCRILAIAQDPGGAAALSPVLMALHDLSAVSCRVLTRAHGIGVFAGVGVPFLAFDEMVRPGEEWLAAARRILEEEGCDLLITGTSFGPSPERAFIRASRQMGIGSFTLLDSWTNYRRRFLEPGETDLTMEVLPDAIGIMNEFGRKEMEAEGFPSQVLHVVGQPALDGFLSRVRERERAERDALRKRMTVPIGEPILSYFSQPIEALYGPSGSPTFRGYTERDVLDVLVETVPTLPGRPTLLVKPHVKESVEHYADHVRRDVAWRLVDESDETLVLGSDVVMGMTSVALVKAFLAGRAVVSVQPNLKGEDQCVLARAGCIKTVTQKNHLMDALMRALAHDGQNLSEGFLGSLGDGQAVTQIRTLIESLLNGRT